MKQLIATTLFVALGLFIPASEAAAVLIIYNSDGSCKACIGSAAACKEACGKVAVAAGQNQVAVMAGEVHEADVIEVRDVSQIADGLYFGHVTVIHDGQIVADNMLPLDEVSVIDLDAQATNVVNDVVDAFECQ